MQSAVTGINTVRIYNPIKNSIDLDPKAEFIKKWLPELSNIPSENVHQPWKMTLIEQQMYDFQVGKDYPDPIVDIDISRKEASNKIWEIKKTEKSNYFGKKILKKHVNS